MRLSEVQVRGRAGRAGWAGVRVSGSCGGGRPCSNRVFPTDKNLVSESPHETQAPAAGLPAERPLPGSALPAGAALRSPLCTRQWLAASVPLGIPTGASRSDTVPCLHVGPPPSGSSLPGLGVGPGSQAASSVLPPGPWGPGAHTGSSPVQGTLGPVCPAPDQGCLLRKCDKPEAWAGAGAVPPRAGACRAAPGSSLESHLQSVPSQ